MAIELAGLRAEYKVQNDQDPSVESSHSEKSLDGLALALRGLAQARYTKALFELTKVMIQQPDNQELPGLVERVGDLSEHELGYRAELPFTPEFTPQDLLAQYEQQLDIMSRYALVVDYDLTWQYRQHLDPRIPPKTKVIQEGVGGQIFPFPTLESVASSLIEKTHLIKDKMSQGFTKLLIVPFGCRLSYIFPAYDSAVGRFYDQKKLFHNDGTPLTRKPLFMRDDVFRSGDDPQNDQIVYYPSDHRLGDDHDGLGKTDLLKQSENSYTPGYDILLIEDLPIVPPMGQGNIKGGRLQIESGISVSDYRRRIQTYKACHREVGFRPEDWFAYAFIHLTENGKILDERSGPGSRFLCNGAFVPYNSSVPEISFNSSNAFSLRPFGVADYNSETCMRSAVNVTHLNE